MSTYIVWDAAKSLGNVIELDTAYKTKKVTIITHAIGVKPEALMNIVMNAGTYQKPVVSPGAWDKLVSEAKDEEARHNQELGIEATAEVVWHTVGAEDEE